MLSINYCMTETSGLIKNKYSHVKAKDRILPLVPLQWTFNMYLTLPLDVQLTSFRSFLSSHLCFYLRVFEFDVYLELCLSVL